VAAPPTRLRLDPSVVVTAAGLVVFLVLRLYGLRPHRSDEVIYFYDALRMSEGAWLYRDLFFAHPPLHLLLPALLTALFGYSFTLLKLLPALAGAAQGVLAYAIGRRAFESGLAGAVAAIALLFQEDFLKSTTFLTGINQAGALWCGALLCVLLRRWLLAGALAGASCMTLLQTAPVCVALGALALLAGRRELLRFGAAFLAVVLAAHAVGVALGGGAFFDQVYLYHLNKLGPGGLGVFRLLVTDNLTLVIAGTLSLSLFWCEPDEPRRRILLFLAGAALVHWAAMVTRPNAFPFYFQPLLVLLALGVGWAASRLEKGGLTATAAGLAAVALVGPLLLRQPLTDLIAPRRGEQLRTYAQHYTWRDAPALGPLNGVVRALFWSDDRVAGVWTSGVLEFLWMQSRAFDSVDQLVQEVVARSSPGDTLFGDSTSLPLVALGSGRRIALDFADTNTQRFESGATDPRQTVAALEAAPPRLVVSRESGCFTIAVLREWLDSHYRLVGTYRDLDGTSYSLHTRAPP
jgi:hypothetical protein